jgi:N-acetylglutamate synthase-like GNAT family acetyltransferase
MTKIVCRKAKLEDVPAIVDIAVESVSRDPLPVKINRDAMADTARNCLNPAHFMWVAEQDGKVVASVAACVQQSFWFDKLQCSVLLYYTRVPGAGVALLREFAKWVKSRSAIKVAVLELEPNADPRLVKFLKRVGFERESLNLSYVRKVTV